MRVLVTGCAGFMGSWLANYLSKQHEVVGVDNFLGGFRENIPKGIIFKNIDLRDRFSVERLFKRYKPEVVFHLAAYAAEGQSVFSPIEINDNNITPMNILLVAAVNNDVKRIVFTSSMAVYGRVNQPPFDESMPRAPVDPYGAAKAYCENMLEVFNEAYGIEYTIIRPHNCFGPLQNTADAFRNVLGIWMNRILRGKPPLIYGDGEQERAFSYIGDVTPPLARAGFEKKANKQIINLGSPEVVTINKACKLLLDVAGSDFEPVYMPARPCEVKRAFCTTDKSEKILKYKFKTPLKKGLEKMWEWAKEKGPRTPTYKIPLEITKNAPEYWVRRMI